MAKQGRSLEKLVATLEKVLKARQDIKIISPWRGPDKVTGQMREHDVVIIIPGHHEVLIALECRDRTRPVGVNAVEEFTQKCRDTGVNKGGMVSSSGFAKTALLKARANLIECLSLDEVEAFDWLGTDHLALVSRQIKSISVAMFDDNGKNLGVPARVIDSGGNGVPFDQIAAWAARTAKEQLDEASADGADQQFNEGAQSFEFIHRHPGLTLESASGDRAEVRIIRAKVSYEVKKTNVPIRRHRYTNVTDNVVISNSATASVDGMHLVLNQQLDGSIMVSVVPDQTKNNLKEIKGQGEA